MENRFFFILRNLSVFLFLCPAITLYAQDIVDLKEQYDKAIALYNGNDYHAAAAVLEEILPEVEKVYEDTASYYNLLNTLGDTYLQLSQPMKAKTCFYRVWKAYLANPRPQHTEYSLFAAVSLGNIYQSTRHTDSVFYFYQQAVKTWDDLQGEWDDTYLDLYSNMLVASEKIHPVKDVDSLYIRYLKRIAKVKSKNDVLYAQTQVSLADRYVQQESFEQAQPLYTEGLKVLKDSGMVQEFLYLEGNYNLGRIWMKKINILRQNQCLWKHGREQKAFSSTFVCVLILLYSWPTSPGITVVTTKR